MRRRTFLRTGTAAALATTALPGLAAARRGGSTQQSLAPSFVGDVAGLADVDVDEDGETVYGAAWDSLVVADASDPAAVRVLAHTTVSDGDTEFTGLQDVSASGDRVLVGGPPGFVDDGQAAGAALVDVSDPANPEQVATIATEHAVHNLYLDGDTAYLTGYMLRDQPVVVYDVADDDPMEVARWSVLSARPDWKGKNSSLYQCHDVYAQDDRAYVAYWDAGTWILDVSDPADPTPTTQLGGVDPSTVGERDLPEMMQLPGNSHYARPTPDGDYLLVGRECWDRNPDDDRYGGPGGIGVYDVTDETDPAFVTALRPPIVAAPNGDKYTGTAHNFAFRDRRLYASWYGGGVRVYDLDDPRNPTRVGAWASPRQASFWNARPLAEGFVAPSPYVPSKDSDRDEHYPYAKLYTFPEPSGEGDPAGTFEVSSTGVPEDPPDYHFDREATTDTSTATSTSTSTSTATSTATAASSSTRSTEPGGSGGSVPGFGVGAAVAGTALAALHRVRGRDDE